MNGERQREKEENRGIKFKETVSRDKLLSAKPVIRRGRKAYD